MKFLNHLWAWAKIIGHFPGIFWWTLSAKPGAEEKAVEIERLARLALGHEYAAGDLDDAANHWRPKLREMAGCNHREANN